MKRRKKRTSVPPEVLAEALTDCDEELTPALDALAQQFGCTRQELARAVVNESIALLLKPPTNESNEGTTQ
jgi:hypothetical protein